MAWGASNWVAPAAAASHSTQLGQPRTTTAPFGRGYTRRQWDLDANHEPINLVDTGDSAPCFADFLDALDCAGVSRSVIDAATEPATHYPYPSNSPICH